MSEVLACANETLPPHSLCVKVFYPVSGTANAYEAATAHRTHGDGPLSELLLKNRLSLIDRVAGVD